MYKINKFDSFLDNFLLIESRLIFSPDLKNILSDLREEGLVIAMFLLEVYDRDMKLVQNFIDIGKEIGTLSFIPDSKIKQEEIYYSINNDEIATRYMLEPLKVKHELVTNITNISNIWKISEVKYGSDFEDIYYRPFIYYIMQNVESSEIFTVVYTDINDTNLQGIYPISDIEGKRNNIRIGRLINSILDIWFKENLKTPISKKERSFFTTSDIEKFVNAVTSHLQSISGIYDSFEIVSGEEIKKWYSIRNYLSDRGQLGASCMRYDNCQGYFGIYIYNPEVCQMVILKNGDKLIGRALLWTDINGKKWLDRIYTEKDSYQSLFKKYLISSDIDCEFIKPDDEREIIVSLKSIEYKLFPYLDTLNFLVEKDDKITISNMPPKYKREAISLTETNGGYEY